MTQTDEIAAESLSESVESEAESKSKNPRKSLLQKLFSRFRAERCPGHHPDESQTDAPGIKSGEHGKPSRVDNLKRVDGIASVNVIQMADKRSSLPRKKEPSQMTQRLSVIAKKGGVGKSTIAMALAGHFATNGMRVLICDLDPQATASDNCLTKAKAQALPGDQTVMALFHDELEPTPDEIIHQSHFENIWVLPANDHFAPYLDPRPLQVPVGQQVALSDFLDEVSDNFDWVIMDSTPALENLAAWNCLTAADYVISPVQMEGYSAQTVVGVEDAVVAALQNGNPELQFLGYLVSEFDNNRKADHKQAEKTLRARYGQQIFDAVIYRRAKLPQSQAADQHIYTFAPKSDEARMIDSVATELVARIEKSKARRAA